MCRIGFGLMLSVVALAACSASGPGVTDTDASPLDGSAVDGDERADATDGALESATDSPRSPDVAVSMEAAVIDVADPVDLVLVDAMDVPLSSDVPPSMDTGAPLDAGSPIDVIPPRDVMPPVDVGASCSVAYLGTCITRRLSDGAVTECRDYSLSAAYPSRDVYMAGCPATNAAIVRSWQSAPCPRATSVGGCRVDSASGPGLCYSQIDWYFPPNTATGAQRTCTAGGRTWIAP